MDKIKVLFVCMGNICRSPSAEFVFAEVVSRAGLGHCIEWDSAGTHGFHVGDKADPRTIEAALKRGIDLNPHRARKVSRDDFETYDYVLVMDQANLDRIEEICPSEHREKVKLFLDFAPHLPHREVPDPYYSGAMAFDLVLDLVEAASQGLLGDICQQFTLKQSGL